MSPVSTLLVFFAFLLTHPLLAAQRGTSKSSGMAEQVDSLTDSLGYVKHEVHNHDIEIVSLQNELKALQMSFESLSRELPEIEKTVDRFNTQVISEQKGVSKALANDVQTLKKHMEGTTKTVDGLKVRLDSLDKTMKNFEEALKQLKKSTLLVMEALDLSDGSSSTYVVKSGDTLEKIAKSTGVSISKLKQINRLKSDRIRVGQKLSLSEN